LSDKKLEKKPTEPSRPATDDRSSLRWLGLGIEFIGVMGIFSYFGYVADEKFLTDPWLMLTGMIIGFVGMMYLLIKETSQWRR